MKMGTFDRVIASMHYLLEDTTTPRSVRECLSRQISYLKTSRDDAARKKEAVSSQIDPLTMDPNMPFDVRAQLMGILGKIEEIGNDEFDDDSPRLHGA